MLAVLERAIGWDGFRLFGVDPRTALIDRLIAASDNDQVARREWLEEVYLDDRTLPYLQLPAIVRARLRAAAYHPRQEESWGFPREMLEPIDPRRHWEYYFESESPIGGTLHASLRSGERPVAVLQAYRRDPDRGFLPKDVALLRAAAPIMGQALAESIDRERQLARTPDGLPSGFVAIGPDRSIRYATSAGTEWLDRLRAANDRDRGDIPVAIWSALKTLPVSGLPLYRIQAASTAGPVSIEASDGGDGAVSVILAPVRPDRPIDIPAQWGLTPQQRQIMLALVTGATNRQIGERLFIGEHTVEWHIRQIFRRLDVSSRTQLQARFFREAMLADVLGETTTGRQ